MELHGLHVFKGAAGYRVGRVNGARSLYYFIFWGLTNAAANMRNYKLCDWSDVLVDDLPPELLNTFILENCYD